MYIRKESRHKIDELHRRPLFLLLLLPGSAYSHITATLRQRPGGGKGGAKDKRTGISQRKPGQFPLSFFPFFFLAAHPFSPIAPSVRILVPVPVMGLTIKKWHLRIYVFYESTTVNQPASAQCQRSLLPVFQIPILLHWVHYNSLLSTD